MLLLPAKQQLFNRTGGGVVHMASVAIVPLIELVLPTHISNYSRYMNGVPSANLAAPAPTAVGWQVANRAMLYPLTIPAAFTIRHFQWPVGNVSAGNFDFGIYDQNFSLLRSLGTTAFPATGTLQSNPITPLKLQPGNYFVAFVASDITAEVYALITSTTLLSLAGSMFGANAALPLPLTITPSINTTSRIMALTVASQEF